MRMEGDREVPQTEGKGQDVVSGGGEFLPDSGTLKKSLPVAQAAWSGGATPAVQVPGPGPLMDKCT